MGVPRQLTQLAFAAGLDESTEDEVLDPSAGFAVLQNARQTRRGGASKRLGFGALPVARMGASDRSAGRRLFSHRDTPCIIDGATLDSYTGQLTTNVSAGRVPDVTIETRPLPASVTLDAGTHTDAVICNGVLLVVYATATNGAFAVVSTIDENVLLGTFHVSASTDPIFQIGSVGSTAVLITSTYSGAAVYYSTLDCSSAASIAAGWVGPTSFATDKKTNTSNLSLESLTNRVAVAYINNAGASANRVTVDSLNGSGLIESRTVNTSHAVPDTLAVAGTIADTLWVSWNEATLLRAIGIDGASLLTTKATLATVATGGTFLAAYPPSIILSATPGTASILAFTADGNLRTRTWTTTAGAVTPVASEADAIGAQPASRAFSRSGRSYALFSVGSNVVLCDYTSMVADARVRPIGYAYPGVASADPSAHVVTLPDGRYGYVVAVETAASVQSYALVVYDFADPNAWRPASHNGVTALSGGILSYFSSDIVQEVAFLHPPSGLDATNDGGGTGPTGTVNYVAVFNAVDGAGNLSISGVSEPFELVGVGHQVLLACNPLLMTSRSAVTVTFYRTIASGKIYYDVGTADALRSPSLPGVVDIFDDSAVINRPLLYGTGALPGTNGSALQRDAPPYCRDVESYAGMLVIASGSELWWSGQTVGGEGTWFSTESFRQTVDGEGDITALASQDGTLYVFKGRAIYVVAGEAPSDNGSSGGLSQPRLLAGDVGCIRTSSVVVTSAGIFFQSHRGIEVLAGGGRPSWIGEKVQNTLAAFPYVTSAALDERNNVVRFSLASGFQASGAVEAWDSEAGSSQGGRDLVFDLVMNDWQSVDDKTGATVHAASQDAAIITVDDVTRYAWLSSDGTVWLERLVTNSLAYRDGAAWVEQAAESGWFKAAGIQGRQQFELLLALFRKHSPMDLSMQLGFDYRETYETATVRSNATLDALLSAGWPITQIRHDGSDNAEGQAVRVRIADADPLVGGDDSGQGATWLALTLNITPKDGPAEVPEEAA